MVGIIDLFLAEERSRRTTRIRITRAFSNTVETFVVPLHRFTANRIDRSSYTVAGFFHSAFISRLS